MSILVDLYDIKEKNKDKLPTCHECSYIPVWELKQHLATPPKLAWACSVHIDTVLFHMKYERIGQAKPTVGEPGMENT